MCPDAFKQLIDDPRARTPPHHAMLGGKRNKVPATNWKIGRKHLLLRNEPHATTNINAAVGEPARAHNRVEQSGFAHAVGAQNNNEFAARDGQVKACPQRRDGGIGKAEEHGQKL
ncbi:hypothetical protein GCM10027157_19330 [Corynebacterium aquatimens]